MKLPKLRRKKKNSVEEPAEEDLSIRERMEREKEGQVPVQEDEQTSEVEPGSGSASQPKTSQEAPENAKGAETEKASGSGPSATGSEKGADAADGGGEMSDQPYDDRDEDEDEEEEEEKKKKKRSSRKKKKGGGKKRLIPMVAAVLVVVAVAAVAGFFLLRGRNQEGGGKEEEELLASSVSSSAEADSSASSAAVSSAELVGPVQESTTAVSQELLTLSESVDYITHLSPSVLGLSGDSMAQYEVLPEDGTVLLDGVPCTKVNIYARGAESGTNEIQGTYLLSRSVGGQRLFRLDRETGEAVEVDMNSSLGQAVMEQTETATDNADD